MAYKLYMCQWHLKKKRSLLFTLEQSHMFSFLTGGYYHHRFNTESFYITAGKEDGAAITPAEATIKTHFVLWYCGNTRRPAEWRGLGELAATPARCTVQEDTALRHIHHADNCETRSFAHDKPTWPQWHRLLIGILTAGRIPILAVPLFISCLIKATVNL